MTLRCFKETTQNLYIWATAFLRQNVTGFQLVRHQKLICVPLCAPKKIFNRTMYGGLLNSTSATDPHLIIQTNTPYIGSTQRPVSSSAFYMSTARVLKEGEINKPDLVTYIVLFFFLLLAVTIIVLFINCQLKNSFFATLPYDRSLREARSPWKSQAV